MKYYDNIPICVYIYIYSSIYIYIYYIVKVINVEKIIMWTAFRVGHDLDFKIKIMILKSKQLFDFDFKSSEISMILILKRIKTQNNFMISYYN